MSTAQLRDRKVEPPGMLRGGDGAETPRTPRETSVVSPAVPRGASPVTMDGNNKQCRPLLGGTPAYRNTQTVTLRACDNCKTKYEHTRSTSRFCSARCRVAWNRKRKRRSVHFRTDSCEWATPQDLFDELDGEFGFDLDVCATSGNAKCGRFYTKADNGLQQPWNGVCWMNPPYGRAIGQWVQKASVAARSGATVVCLLPARTDTAWWQDYCAEHEVRFIRGRLKFGGSKNPAPFPSAVVVMRPAARRTDRLFPPLGTEPKPGMANTGVERSLT